MNVSRPRIWVDTDIALGAPQGDMDDGFALAALAAAHRQGSVELVGVSTVFGNSTAATSEACARELLRRAGVEVPIVRGAEGEGIATPAPEALAAPRNNIEIVAIGPLTNVAAACRLDGQLPARAILRVVGGNLSSRGFLAPFWPFEFNLARDLESARQVLSLPWKQLTLFPLDVVRQLEADSTRLRELERTGALGSFLAQGSRRWLQRARWRRLALRFPLWDLPAALDAAGMLDSEIGVRRLASGARRWLRAPGAFPCLTGFDPGTAWKRFRHLIEETTERSH